MTPTTLVVVLLAVSVALHVTAPRQARSRARTWDSSGHGAADRDALAAELTRRLRVGAVGAAIGTLTGAAALYAGAAADDTRGPDGLADVAVVLASTVVCAAAAEAVNVWRRTPAPAGRRAAALVPRTTHPAGRHRLGETVLVVLMIATTALAVATVAQDVRGARGAVAAAVGALVVTAVCAAVRARTVHHAVVAEDDRELVVALAAGEASIDRFGENIVASGGVLTLASLLVPAVAAGPGALRTSALVLGAAVLACVLALVLLRRSERAEVPA